MSIVPIIMGSKSDLKHGQAIADALAEFGIASEIRVASAHKAPRFALEVLAGYESDPQPKVYITVAGRSNALSGLVDGAVAAPVIACPPYSDRFGGADVFSSLRMPSGIAPAVVLEPSDAFGERDESLVQTISKADFPPGVKVGGTLRGVADDGGERIFTVVKIKGPQVILDGNHPHAGKTLRFSLKVEGVQAASAEEVAHGHAHGAHGHHH